MFGGVKFARFITLLGFILAVMAASCTRNSQTSDSLDAGRSISGDQLFAEVGGCYLGDSQYEVVSYAALQGYYDDFRAEIFRQGVTKWDPRFDCNHFASYYVALAETRFYLANFQSRNPAQTLALGEYWYRPDWAHGAAHAVVIAMTDRGLVWIEPQTGQVFAPTDAEKMTAILKEF